MKARLPSLVQGLVIAAGFSVALASLFSFRLEDWPIYVTYVLLSMVLYRPTVEVLPGLLLPMPGSRSRSVFSTSAASRSSS